MARFRLEVSYWFELRLVQLEACLICSNQLSHLYIFQLIEREREKERERNVIIGRERESVCVFSRSQYGLLGMMSTRDLFRQLIPITVHAFQWYNLSLH